MKLGIVQTLSEKVLALQWHQRWFNFTRAYQTYQREVQNAEAAPIYCVERLLEAGLVNTESLRLVVEHLEHKQTLLQYLLPEPLMFGLPLRPKQIIALGRNYAAHAAETGHSSPPEPIFFGKSPRSCIGPGEAIVARPGYGRVDHEAELALVIGRTASRIDPEEARGCIAAYTLLNDVTARDMQKTDIAAGHPWFRSKSIDTFCPLGPFLVLPDEMPWPVHVDIECRVNGEIRQKSNTANFIFGIPEMLAYITQFITLEAGDLVTTGTPEGISPIRPGETVEVLAPPIGMLANPVVAG